MRRRSAIVAVVLLAGALLVARPAQAQPTFDSVVAFTTKTGFRGVVAWQTSVPIAAEVRFGQDAENLTRSVRPQHVVADRAGMVLLEDLFPPGKNPVNDTWYVQVRDTTTGAASAVTELDAANAYRDWNGSTYTIDLLVSLDTPAINDDVPGDLGLRDIADAMNILAERIYDATDGFARIGTVLVTEIDPTNDLGFELGCTTPTAVADIEVLTVPPFSSQTYSWGIEDPCSTIMLGREGQLTNHRWIDDLHVGHVASHELGHYGFGADDLYTFAGDYPGGINCDNPAWDGSLMHNSGRWNATLDRWENTEFDRNPRLTPCQHGSAVWTWDELRTRYTNVPLRRDGPVEHILDLDARGNADGGALDIWVLDRSDQGSSLTSFIPRDDLPVP